MNRHASARRKLATKYPRYAKYRDSGVAWLGEVPAHWEVKRLRFLAATNPLASKLKDIAADDLVSFVSMDAVGEYGGLRLDVEREFADIGGGYTYFADGDVVLAKITPCFENGKGAIAGGLTNGIAFGTTELHVMRASEELDRRFLFYLTIAYPFRKIGESEMYGAGGQKRVPEDFIKDFRTPLPPIDEQRAIAAFLDHQTTRIDALIATKRRFLALLQEKRASLVNHVVTRGLAPDVRLKNSGVAWVDSIPSHWAVRPLKRVADVRTGVAKGRKIEHEDSIVVPYLRVANVQDGYLVLDDIAEIEIGVDELHRYALHPGDVLMNEGGDNDKLGRGHVWQGEVSPCIHQNHVFAVRPQTVHPDWLALVTGSDYAKHYFYCFAKQSTNLASISSTNLKNLPVILPPADEQIAILDYVARIASNLQGLQARSESVIQRLVERRASLVAAAVTGKIDTGITA